MNALTIISVALYCLFSFWHRRCFLYQRTLLTLERKENIEVRIIPGVYPKRYIITYKISILRFIILGYLVLTKWYLALILAAIHYILPLMITVNDSKHLKILIKQLKFSTDTRIHLIREKAGKSLAFTDNKPIYCNLGNMFIIPVCNRFVKGEIVDIKEKTKELIVLFDHEFGINNSFPHNIHILSLNQLDRLKNGELTTDFNHYRF